MVKEHSLQRHVRSTLITVSMLALSTIVGFMFDQFGFKEVSIYTEYILSIILIAVLTADRLYGIIASICGILIFNFLFAVPRMSFLGANYGYPLDFIILLAVSILVSSLAQKAEQLSFRTHALLETAQQYLQASGEEQIIAITGDRLHKLLERPMVFYMAGKNGLNAPVRFGDVPVLARPDLAAAQHALDTGKDSGRHTLYLSNARCTYMVIRTADRALGVAGAVVSEKSPLTETESELMRALLSECALTLERDYYDRKRQEAAAQIRHEKLRSDLLRSISHDLRTPLTSISGNASLLSEQAEHLSEEKKQQLAATIGQDAQWLLGTVENLLSVTRIEDGRMALRLQPELISDVISEAVAYAGRYIHTHTLECELEDELLMARIDARLIMQVLVNLIDNAAKYTPPGSVIRVSAERRDGCIAVTVTDNGPGIDDAHKAAIFDMFYTTSAGSIDGRRGLGLGLALCKAIVHAHGGSIAVTDHMPHGAAFTFTLKEERIELP